MSTLRFSIIPMLLSIAAVCALGQSCFDCVDTPDLCCQDGNVSCCSGIWTCGGCPDTCDDYPSCQSAADCPDDTFTCQGTCCVPQCFIGSPCGSNCCGNDQQCDDGVCVGPCDYPCSGGPFGDCGYLKDDGDGEWQCVTGCCVDPACSAHMGQACGGCGTTQCNGSCNDPCGCSETAGVPCGNCGTIACNGVTCDDLCACVSDYGHPCGTCGTVGCYGACDDPCACVSNMGQPCGGCGNSVTCNGTCSGSCTYGAPLARPRRARIVRLTVGTPGFSSRIAPVLAAITLGRGRADIADSIIAMAVATIRAMDAILTRGNSRTTARTAALCNAMARALIANTRLASLAADAELIPANRAAILVMVATPTMATAAGSVGLTIVAAIAKIRARVAVPMMAEGAAVAELTIAAAIAMIPAMGVITSMDRGAVIAELSIATATAKILASSY